MGMSSYQRAKLAKKNLKSIDRLGWPDTEDGIKRLFAEMPTDEQTVCLTGRFVKRWNGWKFMFPPTSLVCDALEGKIPQEKELLFVEDEEG